MRNRKRLTCTVLALILAIFLLAPSVTCATAATGAAPVFCGMVEDNQFVALRIGIPLLLDDTPCVLVSPELYYASEEPLVVLGDTLTRMAFSTTLSCEMDVYQVSTDQTSLFYKTAAFTQGADYTLVGINSEMELVAVSATITDSSDEANTDSFYVLTVELNEQTSDDIYLPVALVNQRNECVGFGISGMSFYGFAPTENVRETAPAADPDDAADPAPTRSAPGGDAGDEGQSMDTRYLYFGIGAAAVLLAVWAARFLSRKNQSGGSHRPAADQTPSDFPETMPFGSAPAGQPAHTGWESVSAPPQGTGVYLECTGGGFQGTRYPFSGRSVLIGRAEDAAIRYPANTKGVSRRHCQIVLQNGALLLTDLGSTSGTYLGRIGRLSPNSPVPLSDGDTFYLGSRNISVTVRIR